MTCIKYARDKIRHFLRRRKRATQSGRPTLFQVRCLAATLDITKAHGLSEPRYRYVESKFPHYFMSITVRGQEYEIAIFLDDVVMYHEDQIFEVYLHRERKSEETLIAGFASRLNRWLEEGKWEEPDEVDFITMLKRAVKRTLQ